MIEQMKDGELRRRSRRQLLKLAPVAALGVFAFPKASDWLVTEGVRFSDWAAGELFRGQHLAQTFSNAQEAPIEKFPYNGYDVLDPEVDLENWTLTVEGDVQHPGEYKLSQITALPKINQNTRHICVEGWDVIGAFGGTRISDFMTLVGGNESARFIEVEMASALHPQSLLCYEMYGHPLDRKHGAPLRLQMPTKLGYKQAKYLDTLRVTSVLKPGKTGYWEDQGYSWFGGL
jgi:DMSO/TMAO reductase YedYZ molybdopterin-dependent catalytic subunit